MNPELVRPERYQAMKVFEPTCGPSSPSQVSPAGSGRVRSGPVPLSELSGASRILSSKPPKGEWGPGSGSVLTWANTGRSSNYGSPASQVN